MSDVDVHFAAERYASALAHSKRELREDKCSSTASARERVPAKLNIREGTIYPAPRIRCDGKAGLVYVWGFFSANERNAQ